MEQITETALEAVNEGAQSIVEAVPQEGKGSGTIIGFISGVLVTTGVFVARHFWKKRQEKHYFTKGEPVEAEVVEDQDSTEETE